MEVKLCNTDEDVFPNLVELALAVEFEIDAENSERCCYILIVTLIYISGPVMLGILASLSLSQIEAQIGSLVKGGI